MTGSSIGKRFTWAQVIRHDLVIRKDLAIKVSPVIEKSLAKSGQITEVFKNRI